MPAIEIVPCTSMSRTDDDGKITLQRLPVRAVVERNVNAELRSRIEKSAHVRIGANNVDERAIRNAAVRSRSNARRRRSFYRCRGGNLRAGDDRPRCTRCCGRARRIDDSDFTPRCSCAGVTFFQCAPPSRVIQTRPSSVPAQSVFASNGEGASAYTTPRRGTPSLSRKRRGIEIRADVSSLAGPVRSGLMIFHEFPSSRRAEDVLACRVERAVDR